MYPMIAGLAGILGTGQCGFRDREGKDTWVELSRWSGYRRRERVRPRPGCNSSLQGASGGTDWAGHRQFSGVRGPVPREPLGAKLIGEPSAGYLSGVEVKTLSNGGAVAVTGVSAVDADGNEWPEALLPHAPCSPPSVDRAIPLVLGNEEAG